MSKGKRDRNRAAARRIVEQQNAAARRRQVTLWTSVAVCGVLVIAGLIGWGVYASQHNDDASEVATPSVAVDDGTAFAIGSGPVTIDLYEDFMCPICHDFEKANDATINRLVADKQVTVQYHPVAILDRASNGTQYSTRAAAAAAAAAESGRFKEFHDLLYQNQPQENSDGLDNAKLIELGRSAGLVDSFARAVNDRTYWGWAGKVTDAFSARGYIGTPTVVVNGKQLQGANGSVPTPDELTKAVEAAAV